MKKFLLLFVSCVVFSAFAFTAEDFSNANYLVQKNIIQPQETEVQYRLDDKILRQEVIGMALKIK